MTMTAAEGPVLPAETTAVTGTDAAPRKRHWTRIAARIVLDLAIAYLLLLAVHAFMGQWTPDYLQGRDLWHFYLSRMVVPMVMLAFFFAFVIAQQTLSHDQTEHPIAKELESVIGTTRLVRIDDAAVSQRLAQQFAVLEGIPQALFNLGEPSVLLLAPAQCTALRKRSPRKPVNSVHGRKSDVVPSKETTVNFAGPTRLS